MHERIVEIILFLVSELKSNKRLSDVDVDSLTRSGYTQTEISTAFTWLFEQLLNGRELEFRGAANRQSVRHLNDIERMIIQPEAYGYLLQCHQLGLLSNEDIEELLEQILAAGFSTIGISEIKSFVAGLLFNAAKDDSSFSVGPHDTIH